MNSIAPIITMLLIGLITGISTGLTGASGVSIVVPLLTLFLSFSIHSAIGTSLIVDVIASLAVVYTYYRHGNIEIRSGIWVLLGSIAGAQLGALIASNIPETGLGIGFGVGMVVMGATTNSTFDKITAKEIQLVDDNGARRVSLRGGADAGIRLYNQDGKIMGNLSTYRTVPNGPDVIHFRLNSANSPAFSISTLNDILFMRLLDHSHRKVLVEGFCGPINDRGDEGFCIQQADRIVDRDGRPLLSTSR